jgi:Lon protease-like protein
MKAATTAGAFVPGPMSAPLPLFPLQSVLFPGGLLSLKVFEARYLDLMSTCLREGSGFGVVALRRGSEVAVPGSQVKTSFESVGCTAEVMEADAVQSGILQVKCRGAQRFRTRSVSHLASGLWQAEVDLLEGDEALAPPPELVAATRGLANAIGALKQRGNAPFLEPYRFDDAGWVANRWCEILPIPLAARQKLMELDDPVVRLRLVDEFLRDKGVVTG